MLFAVRGGFRVFLDEHVDADPGHLVKSGEYVMLPEGRRHTLEIADAECGPMLEQISVHAHMADRWGRPLLARFAEPFGCLADPEATWRALRDLGCLLTDDRETGRIYGEALLRNMMAERARDDDTFQLESPGGDPRIAIALDKMQSALAQPGLSVDELAQDAGLSPVQFRKLFRQGVGRSPKEHLQHLRLQRAAKLLLRTGHNIRRVAEECGFASDHYFHLVFRASTGMTPSEYRAQGGP